MSLAQWLSTNSNFVSHFLLWGHLAVPRDVLLAATRVVGRAGCHYHPVGSPRMLLNSHRTTHHNEELSGPECQQRAETETPCPNSTFRRSSWFCSLHQLFWDWSLPEKLCFLKTHHTPGTSRPLWAVPTVLWSLWLKALLICPWLLHNQKHYVLLLPPVLSSSWFTSSDVHSHVSVSPWPQLQWSLQQKGRWGMAEGKILKQIKLYNVWTNIPESTKPRPLCQSRQHMTD